MNVKESHIVTGMSRDSSVSRQNPNLVYDAHNIRITTKDGKNSVLSVTNEKGTRSVALSAGSNTITGTPLGSAVLGDYVIIFTHQNVAPKDHIYKCTITNTGGVTSATVTKVFEGDAKFNLAHPIETLPIFETEEIQKVYWVDGINQPRMINIIRTSAETDANKLNFSREVVLQHEPIDVEKHMGGGLFPPGTIQYMFSYYDKNGQETRLIDISPMFYISPKEKGAKADSTVQCSFKISLSKLDTSFDYIRIYSLVRTMENSTPTARLLGDFAYSKPSDNNGSLTVTDDGHIGSTVEATSLYFIGGEECIAGTLAQKDNTLFLGDITLTRPNLIDVPITIDGTPTTLGAIQGTTSLATANNPAINHYYCKESTNISNHTPHTNNKYYDYTVDNNRSSYYVKRFKHGETYRLGFIAQYKNGQWSDPLWIADKEQERWPNINGNNYATGKFNASIDSGVVNALLAAGYKRVAPVVVYPQPHERKIVAQGVICPTVFQRKDRDSNNVNLPNTNAPHAQSSWFFRYGTYANAGRIASNNVPAGEIQCMDFGGGSANSNDFWIDTTIITFHSPEIDCVESPDNLDLSGLKLGIIGTADSNAQRIVERFITVENTGINEKYSQVVNITKNLFAGNDYNTRCYPLYCDGIVKNDDKEEVRTVNDDYLVGWIVYPWHRQGSLNNQNILTTKQKSSGFNTRTAMLKRNITATTWFTKTNYSGSYTYKNISEPVLYNSDQLSAVRVRSVNGTYSYNYYGNVDKVLTASDRGKYYIYHGWWCKPSGLSTKSPQQRSEEAITIGYNSTANTAWRTYIQDGSTMIGGTALMEANDPVPMKYKSTPHLVISSEAIAGTGTSSSPQFILAELVKYPYSFTGTNSVDKNTLQWIRCGDSVKLISDTSATIDYMQGDCYVQRYDCLKTYAFTNEDLNSVVEILSTMVETYVNLDFRTDPNRGGSNNYILNPTNFNLFNHYAYEQSGNFFIYRSLDPNIVRTNKFPNVVTWSLEKHFGEDVDTWASVDVSNTLDLDGAMGSLTKLVNYNNDIYAFQSIGFARLLFNSRVQIPTSDNMPIEITNGMKMDGKKYISTKIGCTNKWSIIETPVGLYFNDDILRTTYLYNGQLQDLSTAKGMKSWMNERCTNKVWNPSSFDNCRAFYDKIGKDIYWVYNDTALVYSEVINQYMSFMDYGGVPLIESAGNSTFAALTITNDSGVGEVPIQATSGSSGNIVFTANNINVPIRLTVRVEEPIDQATYQAAEATIDNHTSYIDIAATIYTANTSAQEEEFTKYTLGAIKNKLTALLGSYFTIALDGYLTTSDTIHTPSSGWLDYTVGPINFTPSTDPSQISPFWELGAGDYNTFFGRVKPYWITLISNNYPTENKIFNNVAWRDIVTNGQATEPFHTFDHIRVWTENQDTQSVRFSNVLSLDSSRQPISYNAAVSNLRKKFNVWRCQIPRDKTAPNTSRARISNPWCYIKLSRDISNVERHEIMDIEVDYFM